MDVNSTENWNSTFTDLRALCRGYTVEPNPSTLFCTPFPIYTRTCVCVFGGGGEWIGTNFIIIVSAFSDLGAVVLKKFP